LAILKELLLFYQYSFLEFLDTEELFIFLKN